MEHKTFFCELRFVFLVSFTHMSLIDLIVVFFFKVG
jgi:hypothetical protein